MFINQMFIVEGQKCQSASIRAKNRVFSEKSRGAAGSHFFDPSISRRKRRASRREVIEKAVKTRLRLIDYSKAGR
jgi:hypothetical protein